MKKSYILDEADIKKAVSDYICVIESLGDTKLKIDIKIDTQTEGHGMAEHDVHKVKILVETV